MLGRAGLNLETWTIIDKRFPQTSKRPSKTDSPTACARFP
jgi:hypothetical protein